jgi:capsular polysaccharide biosynthesis protein
MRPERLLDGGMSEQALDLRRSVQILRRHKLVWAVAAGVGLLLGAGYTVLRPPLFSATAVVQVVTTPRGAATEVLIASSNPVLSPVLRAEHDEDSLQALRGELTVKGLTTDLISITALGKTASQAQGTANAVARSFVGYVTASGNPGGPVPAKVLEPAANAERSSLPPRLVLTGVLGALLGALVGAVISLAIGRGAKRLRGRDQIASALGAPVLASLPVRRPTHAERWALLLTDYEPDVVHAVQLRNTLRYLQRTRSAPANGNGRGTVSVAVVSLSSDRRALALGPQLAVYAASLGIPTVLVISPHPGMSSLAALRTACETPRSLSLESRQLQVAVADRNGVTRLPRKAEFVVVTCLVDSKEPRLAGLMRTAATVIGVTAGTATADQLASVAVGLADDGRLIDGVLVADPDPADQTTGCTPALSAPSRPRVPTRRTISPRENRR